MSGCRRKYKERESPAKLRLRRWRVQGRCLQAAARHHGEPDQADRIKARERRGSRGLVAAYVHQGLRFARRESFGRASSQTCPFRARRGTEPEKVACRLLKEKTVKALTGAIELGRARELAVQAALERERSLQKKLVDQIGRCKVKAPSAGRVKYELPISAGAVVHDGQLIFHVIRRCSGEAQGGVRVDQTIGGARMCKASVGFAASTILFLATTSLGGSQQQLQPEGAQLGQLLAPRVTSSLDDEKEIAGLAHASKPEIVTWERTYKLAVVRARVGHGALMQTLDPAALDRQADGLGLADFDQFRKEYFTVFRGRAVDLLALLGRLQTIDNARRRLAVLESLTKLFQEKAQDPSSGLSQLDIDTVLAARVKAGQALDRRNGSTATDSMSSRSRSAVTDTAGHSGPKCARRVPGHLRLGGGLGASSGPGRQAFDPRHRPITGARRRQSQYTAASSAIVANPDDWEEVLAKATQAACSKKRTETAEPRPAPSSNFRLGGESVICSQRAVPYEDAKRGYGLAVRIKDQAFERLLSPPSDGGPERSPLLERFLEQVASVTTFEDQLVELWTTFRAERLELFRDIGVLPYTEWKAFYAELTAQRTGVEGAIRTDPCV